jgi:hypothetical protein
MSSIKDKIKEKVTGAKDKVTDVAEKGKDKVVGTTENVTDTVRGKAHEEGATNTYKDPTREYDEKEPMSPAKIREHEPTAVKREMTERIVEPGQQGTSDPEKAREIARRSGMAKGTAGADETESEYEQGEAGIDK